MDAIVFEGGPTTLAPLRDGVTLDLLGRLVSVCRQVVLVTDREPLAQAVPTAVGPAVQVVRSPSPFHFGTVLRELAQGRSSVLVMGGAALPLLGVEGYRWLADQLAAPEPKVVVNNPLSADLIAFNDVSALDRIELPASDNFLGVLLREAGLERVLLPPAPSVTFDLDTPTDWLILRRCLQLAAPGRSGFDLIEPGPFTRQALASLSWPDSGVLDRALAVLAKQNAEVALIGRVGTVVVDRLNWQNRLRTRVFAEERGMKALGREEAGLVDSLLFRLVRQAGFSAFFEGLAAMVDAAFIDTRVFMAMGGRRLSEQDRFNLDLGLPVADEELTAFAAAAAAAPIPVVLGGHSVVAGGLMVLAELAHRGVGVASPETPFS